MTILGATVRIGGVDLDPDEVSATLDLCADSSHRRGDPRFGQSGRKYSDHSAGLWSLSSALDESAPLAEHLAGLLARLDGREQALRRLRARGLEVDLFLGLSGPPGNFVFAVDPETLGRLSTLGLELVFDVYFEEAQDEEISAAPPGIE